MSKTKIAGLGAVVLVVVALTGCNLFGNNGGSGIGHIPLEPPVRRSAPEAVRGQSASMMASVSSSAGKTPEEHAIDEFNRLLIGLEFTDRRLTELNGRDLDSARLCLTQAPVEVTINFESVQENWGSETMYFQCQERMGDHLIVYFGVNDGQFYLIEVQNNTDNPALTPPQPGFFIRFAIADVATERVDERGVSWKDGDGEGATISHIIANPNPDNNFQVLRSVSPQEPGGLNVAVSNGDIVGLKFVNTVVQGKEEFGIFTNFNGSDGDGTSAQWSNVPTDKVDFENLFNSLFFFLGRSDGRLLELRGLTNFNVQ